MARVERATRLLGQAGVPVPTVHDSDPDRRWILVGVALASMDWIGSGDHDNGGGREYSWWFTQKTTSILF